MAVPQCVAKHMQILPGPPPADAMPYAAEWVEYELSNHGPGAGSGNDSDSDGPAVRKKSALGPCLKQLTSVFNGRWWSDRWEHY
eukprot:4953030-Alexandrium_andersonii.AAC.1